MYADCNNVSQDETRLKARNEHSSKRSKLNNADFYLQGHNNPRMMSKMYQNSEYPQMHPANQMHMKAYKHNSQPHPSSYQYPNMMDYPQMVSHSEIAAMEQYQRRKMMPEQQMNPKYMRPFIPGDPQLDQGCLGNESRGMSSAFRHQIGTSFSQLGKLILLSLPSAKLTLTT